MNALAGIASDVINCLAHHSIAGHFNVERRRDVASFAIEDELNSSVATTTASDAC